MPENRPAVPEELKREVLVEAGHRCAIPGCRQTTVEIAHIVPWAKVKEHRFENLIALCPNCHSRHHKGEIDLKSLQMYKAKLAERNAAFRGQVVDPVVEVRRRLEQWEDESRERFCMLLHDNLWQKEDPHRFVYGEWSVAYCLEGDVPERTFEQWRNILCQVQQDGLVRPLWLVRHDRDSKPYTYEGNLEAVIDWEDPARVACRSDFWRVSLQGLLYETVGYQEDGRGIYFADAWRDDPEPKPGTVFYWHTHPFRVAQALRHASRLSKALEMESALVVARFHWYGLQNRKLSGCRPENVNEILDLQDKICRQPEVVSEIEADVDAIDTKLADLVHEVLEPVYTAFFTELTIEQLGKVLRFQ